MRKLTLVVAALALVGCRESAFLLGPEDPSFEEECTLYVGEGETATITRWQLEHCEAILVVVVKFPGAP